MELKPCNNEVSVRMKTVMISLRNQLGMSCLKWYRNEELDYYVLLIMEYLNKRLILSGTCTILQRLQEFTDTYEMGTEMILSENTEDLAFMIGINTSNPEYNSEVFTMAWGIFMSSVYMQLMYNYAGVFDDNSVSSVDCHSGCIQTECGSLLGTGVMESLGGLGKWESSNYEGGCGCNN